MDGRKGGVFVFDQTICVAPGYELQRRERKDRFTNGHRIDYDLVETTSGMVIANTPPRLGIVEWARRQVGCREEAGS